MFSVLSKLAGWLVRKLAIAVLIVVLGLVTYGLWLFVQDRVDFDTRRSEQLRELRGESERLSALKASIEKRMAELEADLAVQQEQAEKAARIVEILRSLDSWWEQWFGNREQQEMNARRMAELEQKRSEALARITELRQLFTQTKWEREGVEITLNQVSDQLQTVEKNESPVVHYVIMAWTQAKWYVVVALALFIFGPTLGKVVLYYLVAPLVSRGRPIRLTEAIEAVPKISESKVSIETALWPGETLRVKEKYLQASDEGLAKQTRFVLDWRIPFTSLACGLIEMVELSNRQAVGARRVTLSNSVDPHIELAIIHVPENGSLVLRPSFLAGLIGDSPVTIRRRWQIFRWQSWVALQFRFFEFVGPCRLVVAGSRGVRAEYLTEREGIVTPARRMNQNATIGFTPNLAYRPVRAETFWSYYRRMSSLFDDLFAGTGVFVVQETSHPGEGRAAKQFWSSVWNGLLKVLGL